MNKYLFILGLAGTALFSACSTSDDLTSEEPNGAPAVDKAKEAALILEARQDSEIPITLGTGERRGMTRAPLDPGVGGVFSTEPGKYLGVFCLATGYQSSYASNPPIANNWTNDDATGLIVRMKNVPATVTAGNVAFTDHNYYYPIGNWMTYNFYAYYPRQDETVTIDGDNQTTISFSDNQVLEKYYEIDGSQDIIWGMSNPSDAVPVTSAATDAAPYCAKYSRLKKAEGAPEADYLPKLSFEHKLVQFRFFVKAAKIDPADDDDHVIRDNLTNMNLQVTDMYIDNAIYRLSLIVANKNPETQYKNGQLSMMGKSVLTKALRIKEMGTDNNRFGAAYPVDGNSDSHPDWVDKISDYSTPVGYIMLARPNVAYEKDANFKYSLIVKVQYDAGTGTDINSVAIRLDPPASGFEEGKIYNILVNVQSPEMISAKAVLQAWEPWDSNNDGSIDGNDVIEYVSD